jgi:hypothetical protein
MASMTEVELTRWVERIKARRTLRILRSAHGQGIGLTRRLSGL